MCMPFIQKRFAVKCHQRLFGRDRAMKIFPVTQEPRIRLHGRYDRSGDRFWMDYTGSGIEFCFRGCRADIQLTAETGGKDQWVLFEVDGTPQVRIPLLQGTSLYTVIDSHTDDQDLALVSAALRHVRIYKESQAHTGTSDASTSCDLIQIDGELCDLPSRRRIECVGDSITSGEGALSPPANDIGSTVNIEEWTSSYYSWSGYLSRMMDLDVQIVSQGGWGVHCGWNNDIHMSIPSVYSKVCGLIADPFASARGASKEYDFSFDPDVVIVNLGTNDQGAFHQPPWLDPADGKVYKMHRIDEYTNPISSLYAGEDWRVFRDGVVSFAKTLFAKNPRAHILWTYGMMGSQLWSAIESAKRILDEEGYTRFDVLLLPSVSPDEYGANSHPLRSFHEKAAAIIADVIEPYFYEKLVP